MPDFGDYSDMSMDDSADFESFNQVKSADINAAARSSGGNQRGWLSTLAGDAAFGVVDLVDTIASSIPGASRAAGVERGTVNAAMLRLIDKPGLTDFYNQNKEGIGVASGIMGIIGAEIAGRKIAAVAAPFVAGMKSAPFAQRLFTLDRQYAESMATVRAVDMQLAKSGVTGAEAWTTAFNVRQGVVGAVGPQLGTAATLTRGQAANKAFGFAALKGAGEAARFEAVSATFLNQNEFLYSEDMSQNLMWMGLGVGLGAGFQSIAAGYGMRKFVNSDNLRRIRADAIDPTGQEAARLDVAKLGTKTQTFLGHLYGTVSDSVTSMMVAAKAQVPAGVDKTAFNRLAIQQQQQAFEEVTKITAKGLPTQAGTSFDSKAAGFWNHLTGALDKDAGLLYGTEMMGGIADNMTIGGTHAAIEANAKSRFTEIRKLLDDDVNGVKPLGQKEKLALLKEDKALRFQDELTPMALIDNELMPVSQASTFDNWVEPEVRNRATATGGTKIFESFDQTTGRTLNVGIESDGTLHLPKGKSIDDMDHFDVLRLYRSSQHLLTDLSKQVADPNFQWAIPFTMENGKAKYSWFHLDMAEELLARTEGRANINWGTLTRETAQKESLLQKVSALREQVDDLDNPDLLSKLRMRYNLPRLTAYEQGVLGKLDTPVDALVRGAVSQSDDVLQAMSASDFKQAFADVANLSDMFKTNQRSVDKLSGDSFKFMLDSKGQPTKPILMYKRNIAPTDWAQDRLADRIAAKKIHTATMLTGNEAGPITRELVGGILASPDYELGARVTGLMDPQISSSLPGLANVPSQSATGSILNAVTTAEWRARDNPVILAVTRLRETIDNRMRGFMRQSIESAFGDRLTVINGPRNTTSKTLLDTFHTFRGGWDLEKNTIRVASGNGEANAFVLADTVANKNRWKKQFGSDMTKGQTLVDSRGREIVLDDMALDVQKRFNAITDLQRIEKNSLLKAKGLSEIHASDWYTPPQDNQGKYIGFTFDSKGDIVPGGTVIANTQDQFDRELSRMRADPQSAINTAVGSNFRTRDEITEFSTLWDKAQMDMMNPGTTAIQGEKSSKGQLTGMYQQVNRFDESLKYLRDQFITHGDDLLQTMLDDQIKAAKSQANVAGGVTRNADSTKIKYRSIHDYWLEAAQGRNPIANQGSAVGWLYNGAERRFNDFMRERAPGANRVWSAVSDWTSNKVPWQTDAKSQREFEHLRDGLAQHMPFESAMEMVERRSLGARPVELAQITGGANRFTATWMLRMFESAAAVMNMAGVVNAMPAVIRHVSAREGESAVELAARIGHSASIFTAPDGRSFSVPDMARIAYRGFKRAWGKEADSEFAYMASNGFLSQEVAEFHRQFNAIDGRGPIQKFFGGDPTSTSKFGQKGLVGWTSVLTDKSEDFSRSWGHMAGLEMADMMGITNTVAKHNFAHDMANKMIANYSPANRPEIFQGAVGAPIGLFQSFMYAYYQRLFRYVETGDKAAIGVQYAMQSTLFGAKTVPGFAELNNLFFEHSDGDATPYDALYNKFGQSAGDLMMGGTLSNLPKIFGADGVDLYSRGDVSPRILTQNPVTNSAPVAAVSKVMQGIGAAMALFSDQNPHLSSQQVGEVLSNAIPNRPIAGMFEQAMAGGYDTDGLGQVVSQSKTMMDSMYRIMGLRSMQASKEVDAFYQNKQAAEISAGAQEKFNTLIRGAVRDGNMDNIPGFVETYLENGHDPRQVKRMLRSAYEAALKTRGERQLENVIKHPEKMSQVTRLLNAQVGLEFDAESTSPWEMSDPLDNAAAPSATEGVSEF
jgi:hypothetical protein